MTLLGFGNIFDDFVYTWLPHKLYKWGRGGKEALLENKNLLTYSFK